MIDFTTEECFPLCEAAKLLPARDGQRGLHVSTLYRWAKRGAQTPSGRCYLDTLHIGNRLHTSREAMQRFFEACSGDASAKPARPRKVRRRQRDDSVILDDIRRGWGK